MLKALRLPWRAPCIQGGVTVSADDRSGLHDLFYVTLKRNLPSGGPSGGHGAKGYALRVIDGLHASKTDYTPLITRSLQVNAGLWAQRSDLITGVNQVEEAASRHLPAWHRERPP
jgi:hypothetical protein